MSPHLYSEFRALTNWRKFGGNGTPTLSHRLLKKIVVIAVANFWTDIGDLNGHSKLDPWCCSFLHELSVDEFSVSLHVSRVKVDQRDVVFSHAERTTCDHLKLRTFKYFSSFQAATINPFLKQINWFSFHMIQFKTDPKTGIPANYIRIV